MAKKFVRGVTGVDDIEKFDKSLTNVNDLISDGQNTYVHTKKGKVESYYNLTDNIQTITSSGNTITAQKSENGSVSLNTNPKKVLEHDNLKAGDGLTVHHDENTSTIKLESTLKPSGTTAKDLPTGVVYGSGFSDTPTLDFGSQYGYTTLKVADNKYIQLSLKESGASPTLALAYYRFITDRQQSNWRQMIFDSAKVDELLAQKQNTITNNTSIAVSGTGLRQLYSQKQSYSHTNGILKTHVKSVSANTSVSTAEEEFNFIVKINKGATSASFTLNNNDKTKFTNIMTTYGQDNSVRISGLIFTLSGSSLTVSTANSVNNNYVITFSDII